MREIEQKEVEDLLLSQSEMMKEIEGMTQTIKNKDEIIKRLQKDYEQDISKLKSENEALKQQNERVLHKLELMVDVDQENERLKAKNKDAEQCAIDFQNKNTKLEIEIEELKNVNIVIFEDNKKLEEENLNLQQQLKEKDAAMEIMNKQVSRKLR